MKNKIKQLREELNFSQEELSDITGIPIDELEAIENDKCMPSLLAAHDITKAFKKDFIADVFLFDE